MGLRSHLIQIMAATLIATVAATNANSFGTLAEANTYFDTVLHSDVPWTGDDVTVKTPALIMAQQQMTSLVTWTGFVTNQTQKLPWPRTGMWLRNNLAYVDYNTVPDEVKWCQFELARLLIAGDRTAEFDISTNGIIYLRSGPVTLKFKPDNPGPPVMPLAAYGLLIPSWYVGIIGIPRNYVDLERA